MHINVYLPRNSALPTSLGADIRVVEYESSSQLATFLGSNGEAAAVVLTADINEAHQEMIAAAIREHGVRVIEVREGRWDGFAASPLSAACRGVIAGFGTNGIVAAIAALRAS